MSDKPGQEKIIDADVEPLYKPKSSRVKVILYLLGAVVLSVAVAVGYQLAVTGRLDDLFAGRSPSSQQMAPQQAQTVQSARPAPAAPAPAPAAAPVNDARLDALEQRLTALTASIERLQQLPASNAGDPQRLAELEQQVASLRQGSEATAAQRSALQAQVAELQSRISDLGEARSTALRELVREPVAQLMAWSELRERARRGDSFAREATQLGQYAEAQGGNLKTAFAALQPFAEQGVAPAAVLAARYATLVEEQRALPQTGTPAATEKSWWQRSLDKLTGLVSVRRVGTMDSATVEGRLDIAQAELAQGDLAAAVAALDGLTLTSAMQDWRDQAAARLTLDTALDDYGTALRGHLAVR